MPSAACVTSGVTSRNCARSSPLWSREPAKSAPTGSGRSSNERELRAADELDPVAVRILDETQSRAAFPDRVRRALRLDPLAREAGERRVEVVDADRDVPVSTAEVV